MKNQNNKNSNKNTGAFRDGHHVNSKYWKSYKQSLPNELPKNLFDVCIGTMLGDATLYVAKNEGAKLKFEQGYKPLFARIRANKVAHSRS